MTKKVILKLIGKDGIVLKNIKKAFPSISI
jgi:hypothetical protein